MIFRQLFDSTSSTYTYLVADPRTKIAAIIDPVYEQATRDQKLVQDLELELHWILDTHLHADHVTGATELKKKTKARYAIHEHSGAENMDLPLKDQSTIELGDLTIRALATPGHTSGCLSYYVQDRVFTGDALLIRGCGRTDFQEGSPETLFRSIREKIFTLPDETLIYPGHDYKGLTVTTVAEEKKHNPRLRLENTQDDFVRIMNDLRLDPPKKMNTAVPANRRGGAL